jgi:P pilus assembly chaperone PapD
VSRLILPARLRLGRAGARILLALAGCLLLPLPALADLMLYPTRVVFEKNQRAAQVDLINNGTEAATYRISLVNRRMNEAGEFLRVTSPEPDEKFADGMLRFSPRQITLQPGTSQTVRIVVRKPASLEAGEYRSHLQFDKLPDARGPTSVEAKASGEKQIGIVLTTLVGASIPVIVRHEASPAQVGLSHLELKPAAGGDSQPVLSFQFERSGDSSVYGDLAVSFSPDGGPEQEVGAITGIAVYSPNRLRRASLPLHPPPGLALAHGSLHLVYRARPEAGGKTIAQAALALP